MHLLKRRFLKKNLAKILGENPKVNNTMLSFSLESLKRAKVRAIKKAIGRVKIRILGSIKPYNLSKSAKLISILEVSLASCIKKNHRNYSKKHKKNR